MAPVTVANALVQQNAEALAGIAFTQMVRKGAGRLWRITSNVDMKSGAPAFGTPEYMKAQPSAASLRALQDPLPHLQHLRGLRSMPGSL